MSIPPESAILILFLKIYFLHMDGCIVGPKYNYYGISSTSLFPVHLYFQYLTNFQHISISSTCLISSTSLFPVHFQNISNFNLISSTFLISSISLFPVHLYFQCISISSTSLISSISLIPVHL